jgi:hypothetical protein
VQATAVVDQAISQSLPIVTLTATSPTGANAALLAQRATALLQTYVTRAEDAAATPAGQRVQLQVVQSGAPPKLASGHKLVIPIMVFLVVLAAFIGLAFVLENMHPEAALRVRRSVPATDGAANGAADGDGHTPAPFHLALAEGRAKAAPGATATASAHPTAGHGE